MTPTCPHKIHTTPSLSPFRRLAATKSTYTINATPTHTAHTTTHPIPSHRPLRITPSLNRTKREKPTCCATSHLTTCPVTHTHTHTHTLPLFLLLSLSLPLSTAVLTGAGASSAPDVPLDRLSFHLLLHSHARASFLFCAHFPPHLHTPLLLCSLSHSLTLSLSLSLSHAFFPFACSPHWWSFSSPELFSTRLKNSHSQKNRVPCKKKKKQTQTQKQTSSPLSFPSYSFYVSSFGLEALSQRQHTYHSTNSLHPPPLSQLPSTPHTHLKNTKGT